MYRHDTALVQSGGRVEVRLKQGHKLSDLVHGTLKAVMNENSLLRERVYIVNTGQRYALIPEESIQNVHVTPSWLQRLFGKRVRRLPSSDEYDKQNAEYNAFLSAFYKSPNKPYDVVGNMPVRRKTNSSRHDGVRAQHGSRSGSRSRSRSPG